jgi:hypothetical protein
MAIHSLFYRTTDAVPLWISCESAISTLQSNAHGPLISLCADVGARVGVQRQGGNVDLLALRDGVGLEERIHVLHKCYLDIVVVSKRVHRYRNVSYQM